MEEYRKELKKGLNLAKHLRFDKTHPWHRGLVALYGALIEYSDSLIHLVENKKSGAIPVIFRSLMEAYVDLKNLAEERRYGNYMEASYSKEWLRVLESANGTDNPYLTAIGGDSRLGRRIEGERRKLAELRENGFQPLSQYAKFERAGMKEEYRSIYNFLCAHSHNNIRSLIDRFIEIDEEGRDIQLIFFREHHASEFDHYLHMGMHYLRNGSHKIHVALETGLEREFPV